MIAFGTNSLEQQALNNQQWLQFCSENIENIEINIGALNLRELFRSTEAVCWRSIFLFDQFQSQCKREIWWDSTAILQIEILIEIQIQRGGEKELFKIPKYICEYVRTMNQYESYG